MTDDTIVTIFLARAPPPLCSAVSNPLVRRCAASPAFGAALLRPRRRPGPTSALAGRHGSAAATGRHGSGKQQHKVPAPRTQARSVVVTNLTDLTAAAPAPVVVTNPTDLTAAAPPLTNAAQTDHEVPGKTQMETDLAAAALTDETTARRRHCEACRVRNEFSRICHHPLL